MTLKAVVGIAYDYIEALTMALNDYNKDDIRKQYHETLVRNDDATFVVTITYSTVEPVQTIKPQEPTWEFIGHKGVSPNDPDWKEKVFEVNAEDVQSIGDGAHTITADTIATVAMQINRANSENDEDWANVIQDRD